ncbi:YczE/YyaS/YitT family protein [Traorella massiliensis]|uniref:YczE/YyaS/YitT family protein n=1 Tax=Traorella massiliensis TaxID=1903263 RepID=UPI0023541275|nr:hypothetical protein [Traorella massiliensis]
MDKKKIKKYIVFILGSFIMGVGIGLCNFANLGVDPMSVLVLGTYQRLHVSFGMMNLLISLLQLLIAYLLDKKNVTIATLLAMIFVSVGIDTFGLLHLSEALSVFPFDYLWLLGGIAVYCFGIALSQLPHCGYTSYDGVIFGLQKYTNFSYHTIRWGIDLTFLVSGILLKGTAGIGTLMILLLAGRLVEIFYELLEKYVGGTLWH